MDRFTSAATVLLPLAYLVVALDYGRLFFQQRPLLGRWSPVAFAGTLLLHLAYVLVLMVQWRQLPVAGVPQILSLLALAVAADYAVAERLGRERSTGVWMLSLVFLLQLLASLLGPKTPPTLPDLFKSPLFGAHVGLAVFGYAAFLVAAVYGFLFLRLYRELKSGSFRHFYGKLPPLEVLERMLLSALGVSFVTLGGAIATGLVRAWQIGSPGLLYDAEVLVALGVWVLSGVTLLMRTLQRWQGRQAAWASLGGLAVILVSLVAINFVYRTFHGAV